MFASNAGVISDHDPSKNNGHRPGRLKRINSALNSGEGRDSEIALALIGLGKRGVNAILNHSNGTDPKISDELLKLVNQVRNLIKLDNSEMIQLFSKIRGFDRTKLLNAVPLKHLVRLYNSLVRCDMNGIANEVENAINRRPIQERNKYKREDIGPVVYTTGIRLTNGLEESGEYNSHIYVTMK